MAATKPVLKGVNALVLSAIVLLAAGKGVDGGHKAGHDENRIQPNRETL